MLTKIIKTIKGFKAQPLQHDGVLPTVIIIPPMPKVKPPKEATMNMTPNKCGDCKWFKLLFEKNKEIGECYYGPPTTDNPKISNMRDACSKFERKGNWEN
jgi:hypothetical protein